MNRKSRHRAWVHYGECRRCGLKQDVARHEWFRSFPPRCLACGGMLDRKFCRSRIPQAGKRNRHIPGRPRQKHHSKSSSHMIVVSQGTPIVDGRTAPDTSLPAPWEDEQTFGPAS